MLVAEEAGNGRFVLLGVGFDAGENLVERWARLLSMSEGRNGACNKAGGWCACDE